MNPSFTALCTVGFFARLSYALARTPVLPLFALYLGAGPEVIGFVVGVSTITGILFKLPSGALSLNLPLENLKNEKTSFW
jgi:DHA1 family multidrug resistance protein-like MFS transporter